MSKFSKKFVSLASSLLAFTSLAGSAKAMDTSLSYTGANDDDTTCVNPYCPKNDSISEAGDEFHTIRNAWMATTEQHTKFNELRGNMGKRNRFKDAPYDIVNWASNNRAQATEAIGVLVALGVLGGLAYKSGFFNKSLGENKNNENYDNDDENSQLNLNDYNEYE